MDFVEIDPSEIPVAAPADQPILPDQVLQAAQDQVACLERDYLLHQRADSPPELLERLDAEHDQAVEVLTTIQDAMTSAPSAPPGRLVSEAVESPKANQ